MLRTKQFFTLAWLTAVDAVRRPLCLLLTAVCVLLTTATPLLLVHKFGEDGKLVRDSGFAVHFLLGLVLASYAACSTLSEDRRRGTASTVLSKPVGRDLFFLSKFAGLVLTVLAFSWCAMFSTLLAERTAERFVMTKVHVGYFTDWQTGWLTLSAPFTAFALGGLVNYWKHRPFGSAAYAALMLALPVVVLIAGFFDRLGHPAPYDVHLDWRLLPVGTLVTLALVCLAALALALSTRLPPAPTLTIGAGVFLLGLLSDFLLGRHAADHSLARLLYWVVPNWQHFWVCDGLSGGGCVPWTYVLRAAGYALAWSAGVLGLGTLAFRATDLT